MIKGILHKIQFLKIFVETYQNDVLGKYYMLQIVVWSSGKFVLNCVLKGMVAVLSVKRTLFCNCWKRTGRKIKCERSFRDTSLVKEGRGEPLETNSKTNIQKYR